jgi:CDP-diacylglycerol--glycerol-3-phosphate 3-phosphatidyltransferase
LKESAEERMSYTDINMSLFYTLLPAAVFMSFFLGALAVFGGRVLIYGMPKTARVEERGNNMFMGKFLMEYWYWVWKPVERTFIAIKLTPDAVTLLGTLLAMAAGVAFAFGYFVWGGWLMLFGGTFDILDGAIARALKMQSKAGEFLDSTLDRYAELFTLAGLLYYYAGHPFSVVVVLAIIGSTMVSYTRAKAEGVGVQAKMGNMQRPERVFYIGLASAMSPIVANVYEPGVAKPMNYVAMIAITIVAIFSNATALRRLWFTYSTLKKQGKNNNS